MGFNVSTFRSVGLPNGGARPSLFKVTLTFPNIGEIPGITGQQASFQIIASELPASYIGKIPVPYFGRKINVAGDREFADWRCRVINDEGFPIRNALEAWHNAINTMESNRLDPRVSAISPQLSNSYKTTALITQFKKTGPPEIDGEGADKTYEFTGIFPLEVEAIGVDWNDTNQIETFQVTWAYDWWRPMRSANGQTIFPLILNPS